MGFPTKNDHFGLFWGYHHLRKPPFGSQEMSIYQCHSRLNNLQVACISPSNQASAPASPGRTTMQELMTRQQRCCWTFWRDKHIYIRVSSLVIFRVSVRSCNVQSFPILTFASTEVREKVDQLKGIMQDGKRSKCSQLANTVQLNSIEMARICAWVFSHIRTWSSWWVRLVVLVIWYHGC